MIEDSSVDSTVKRLKRNFEGANAEAIAFPVPTVQDKQDCPEDSAQWELRGCDRPSGLGRCGQRSEESDRSLQ